MRGILRLAVALSVAALAPAQAGAHEGDRMDCNAVWNLTGFSDSDSYAGDAFSVTCESTHGYGGFDTRVEGTWSASDCAKGRVGGRITVEFDDYYGDTVIDFDAPTEGGTGTGTATAVNGDGTRGSGPIVLNETLTQSPCPSEIVAPREWDIGPVSGETGGVGRWDVPVLSASFSLTF